MDYRTPNPSLYRVPFRTDDFRGMPYRNLGASGLRVPNVGLGAWKIGYPETGDGARVDAAAAFRLFDRAIELGVTLWDTANRYNDASGNSERVIGEWLKRNPAERRNVLIATKLFGGMDGTTPNHSGLSRANILDSVRASLERLQTDYIDILYFHAFDPLTPPEESLAAVEDLVSRGLVRYFGVSHFSPDQLSMYRDVQRSMTIRCRVTAVQNRFDVLRGESPAHAGVLERAAAFGVSFVAWSPLARGLLTGRYADPAKAGPGDRLYDEGALEKEATPDHLRKVRRLAELARAWGLELSQLVIAYMLTLPGMGPIIPSSTTVAQLESNAAAGKLRLTDEQRTAVAAALTEPPDGRDPSI